MEGKEYLSYKASRDPQAPSSVDPVDLQLMEREFVAKYEQLPLLWKKDHPDYSNKFKRNVGYDVLLPVLKKFIPTANRFSVRQKINILRSTYRKEVRRYLASRTITADGEIVYTFTPTSWKFEAMKFLLEMNEQESKMEIPQSEIEEEMVEDDSFNDLEEQELVFIQEGETESGNEEQIISETPMSPLFVQQKKPIIIKNSRKRAKFNDEKYFLDQECTAVGSNVTCKLQRMNLTQRLYAEQLINKVLIRGLQRTLSEDTDFSESDFSIHKSEVES